MKRILIASIALAALILHAEAAPLSGPCTQTDARGLCTPVNSTNPLPTYLAPSSASAGGTTTTATSALAANLVVSAAAANLHSFNVSADSTLSGAAWWIMIYNATSAPADGAVTPAKCYAMPSGTTSYSAAWPTPVRLGTGVVIGVSTTGCFTKTASTHAFISADYK